MFWELTIKCKTWSIVKLYEYEQVKLKAYYHLMAQYIFCIKPSQSNLLVSKFQENYIKVLATETHIFSGQSKGFIYWFNVDSKHTALPTYSSNEYKGSTLIKECASLSLTVSLIS